jgi:hypothetical protein
MTNTYRKFAMAFGLMGLLASGQSAAADPQSYLLLCKGGNNSFKLRRMMDCPPDSRVRYKSTTVWLNFSRSNRPASAGLTNGSCAWADRGLRTDEPDTLEMKFEQVYVVTTTSIKGTQQTTEHEVLGRQDIAAKLTSLIRALKEGREFQVHAYQNSRSNTLVVTQFGP